MYTSILYVSTHNSTASQQIEMTENWTCIVCNETTMITTTITSTQQQTVSRKFAQYIGANKHPYRDRDETYTIQSCLSRALVVISVNGKLFVQHRICMKYELLSLLNYNYIVLSVCTISVSISVSNSLNKGLNINI